jgi:hypothetical protein
LVGFLLNPLVAPPAAALSCKGGFLALAAYLSGCDPGAKLLGLVATALGWFRDALLWLGAWEYAAVEPVGWGLAITLLAIALISMRLVWARYVEFLLEEGLFFG